MAPALCSLLPRRAFLCLQSWRAPVSTLTTLMLSQCTRRNGTVTMPILTDGHQAFPDPARASHKGKRLLHRVNSPACFRDSLSQPELRHGSFPLANAASTSVGLRLNPGSVCTHWNCEFVKDVSRLMCGIPDRASEGELRHTGRGGDRLPRDAICDAATLGRLVIVTFEPAASAKCS